MDIETLETQLVAAIHQVFQRHATPSNGKGVPEPAQGVGVPVAQAAPVVPPGGMTVKIAKTDPLTGEQHVMEAARSGLEQAMADGWRVVDDDFEVVPVQPAPVGLIEKPLSETLKKGLKGEDGPSPMYQWLFRYLDAEVKGQLFQKSTGKGRGKYQSMLGEILMRRLHDAALEAQEEYGFELECQGWPKGCDGRKKRCPLRVARRELAAQPDFPLRLVKTQAGPWGSVYVYDGFADE